MEIIGFYKSEYVLGFSREDMDMMFPTKMPRCAGDKLKSETADSFNKELDRLRKRYDDLCLAQARPVAEYRKKILEKAIAIAEGARHEARDNTVSAHAIVCDITERLKSEIEYPSDGEM